MRKNSASPIVHIPMCKTLCMRGEYSERWLSRPDSRIVINPFNYDTSPEGGLTQSQYCDRPSLPLNIGYLDPWAVNTRGPELNNILMIFERNSNGSYSEATSFGTSWQPHKLNFEAEYSSGLQIKGYDWFYDNRTIARNFTLRGAGSLVIAGEYSGRVALRSSCISIIAKNYTCSIAHDNQTNRISFFDSIENLMAGRDARAEPIDKHGFYAFELVDSKENTSHTIALTIDTFLLDIDEIQKHVSSAVIDPSRNKRLLEAEKYWDMFLAKIPQIQSFNFRHVKDLGITMTDIQQMYYVGWVLLYSSLAPANPELSFPYRQMTAGKPSLWAYGDPRATYTAAWDSLYGIQLCAFVDSEAAWETFTGIMSMVDNDGMLAGESLPVMRSRTAWILYNQLRSLEYLQRNFDNLERNLIWSMDHPYWIWMENNPLDSTLKDTDFTASLLIDIPYFIEICRELGKCEKIIEWRQKLESYQERYIKWTFPSDGSLPTEKYIAPQDKEDDGTGQRIPGNVLWVTKGLYIKGMDNYYVKKHMDLFFTVFDQSRPFCGFPFVKLEDIQYTIYGLIDNGYIDEACKMIESSIRDVVRSRFFGENYSNDNQPACWGVRPSLFGIVQLVDGIWMRNGYRYDSGKIRLCDVFGAD